MSHEMQPTNGNTPATRVEIKSYTGESASPEDFEFRKRISLQEGDPPIIGVFLGPLPPLMFQSVDEDSGEVEDREVQLWGFQVRSNLVIELMGAAQLNRKLEKAIVGKEYLVVRRGQINLKSGRRMNEYDVAPRIER